MTALTNPNTETRSLLDVASDPHEFMRRALNEFSRPLGRSNVRAGGFDIVRNDENYEFQVNAPGFSSEDIEATIENGSLNVTGSREQEETDGDRVVSRRRTSFEYSWPLGDDMEAENVSASLDNGVLKVTVPRKEQYIEDGAKQIEIE